MSERIYRQHIHTISENRCVWPQPLSSMSKWRPPQYVAIVAELRHSASKPTNMCILFFHNLYFNIYFTKMHLIPTKVEKSTVAFSFLGHGHVDWVSQLACVAHSLLEVRTPGLDNRDYCVVRTDAHTQLAQYPMTTVFKFSQRLHAYFNVFLHLNKFNIQIKLNMLVLLIYEECRMHYRCIVSPQISGHIAGRDMITLLVSTLIQEV